MRLGVNRRAQWEPAPTRACQSQVGAGGERLACVFACLCLSIAPALCKPRARLCSSARYLNRRNKAHIQQARGSMWPTQGLFCGNTPKHTANVAAPSRKCGPLLVVFPHCHTTLGPEHEPSALPGQVWLTPFACLITVRASQSRRRVVSGVFCSRAHGCK